ncbi:MAG: hypothetical protein U9R25_15835 [Chloroflexota bacterium]|nr:hypothetical protein [Chloroflexota bacterium]
MAIVLMWIFTDWVSRAFDGFILPLLGLIFLPYATLFYIVVAPNGVNGFEWLLVIFGFFLDITSYAGGSFSGKQEWDKR